MANLKNIDNTPVKTNITHQQTNLQEVDAVMYNVKLKLRSNLSCCLISTLLLHKNKLSNLPYFANKFTHQEPDGFYVFDITLDTDDFTESVKAITMIFECIYFKSKQHVTLQNIKYVFYYSKFFGANSHELFSKFHFNLLHPNSGICLNGIIGFNGIFQDDIEKHMLILLSSIGFKDTILVLRRKSESTPICTGDTKCTHTIIKMIRDNPGWSITIQKGKYYYVQYRLGSCVHVANILTILAKVP